MTTIICKNTNGIMEMVADKRATGGYNLRQDVKDKLYKVLPVINQKPTWVTFGMAGDSIHNDLVKRILLTNDSKLVGDSIYEIGLVLRRLILENCGIENADIHILLASDTQCIVVSNSGCIEDMDTMLAIGSGYLIAQGIHLGNPDLDIQKYIPLISEKDEKTSPVFDYLKL